MATEHSEKILFTAYCRADALLPPDTVAEMVARAAEELSRAHRAGRVHGDIRPANLIRIGRGKVEIVGWENPDSAEAPLPDAAGRESPDYHPPERVRGSRMDERSDLFSLGAVLYEMLSGAKPFPGDSESSILFRIVHEPPRDLARRVPGLGAEFRDVVERALAKRRDDRFPTAEAMAEALRHATISHNVDRAIGGEPAPGQLPDEPGATSTTSPMAGGVPLPPPTRRARKRFSIFPYVVVALVLIVLGVATARFLRDGSRDPAPVAPPDVWLEARATTEPGGVEVQLDGIPLDPANAGVVKFKSREPFGTLTATLGCRTAEHVLRPEDEGGELVLVLDPVELDWRVDPAVDGAKILLNGEPAGTTPGDLQLDLCKDNRLELRAQGYRPASVDIAAGITPLEARSRLHALTLEAIPKGRIVLPRQKNVELAYYLDGKRLRSSADSLELEEGEHELRIKNEYHWIDERKNLRVVGGETVEPDFGQLVFANLVVQAFPSNCKVYLRRPGSSWRYLDETPASRNVGTGRFEVKVELNPTGETRTREIRLREGDNPPVRFSFRGDG